MSIKKHKFLLAALLIFCFSFSIAQAVEPNEGFSNPLKGDSFIDIFVGIANWLASIVAILAVLMIIISGFQFMTAGGNQEQIKSAQKTIFWAVLGLIVALASWSLLKTVLGILGVK